MFELRPRARRRQATIAEVLAAARDLAREQGLASISMRELGARVGLHASSLYQYFPSKAAIYDALFAEGHRQLQAWMSALDRTGKPVDILKRGSRLFTEFCLQDDVRYQLLFQRTIPGFSPSEASMELAWQSYRDALDALVSAGVTDPTDFDLWTAIQMGLTGQQWANDPGGRRFVDHIDTGIVHVNSGTPGGEAQMPFGGMKGTGVGPREQGETALEFYTEVKSVYIDYTGQARKGSLY